MVLLDYSKAFDCANHRLIIAKLKAAGFKNEALEWVKSYLSGRSQKVVAGSEESDWAFCINGVPQGSVLGPLLFTVLVSDIGDAIKRGRYHLYADDTQLFYHCKVEDANTTVAKINSDLENISNFSRSEEHTSELQSLVNLVCRLLLEKKKKQQHKNKKKKKHK